MESTQKPGVSVGERVGLGVCLGLLWWAPVVLGYIRREVPQAIDVDASTLGLCVWVGYVVGVFGTFAALCSVWLRRCGWLVASGAALLNVVPLLVLAVASGWLVAGAMVGLVTLAGASTVAVTWSATRAALRTVPRGQHTPLLLLETLLPIMLALLAVVVCGRLFLVPSPVDVAVYGVWSVVPIGLLLTVFAIWGIWRWCPPRARRDPNAVAPSRD